MKETTTASYSGRVPPSTLCKAGTALTSYRPNLPPASRCGITTTATLHDKTTTERQTGSKQMPTHRKEAKASSSSSSCHASSSIQTASTSHLPSHPCRIRQSIRRCGCVTSAVTHEMKPASCAAYFLTSVRPTKLIPKTSSHKSLLPPPPPLPAPTSALSRSLTLTTR